MILNLVNLAILILFPGFLVSGYSLSMLPLRPMKYLSARPPGSPQMSPVSPMAAARQAANSFLSKAAFMVGASMMSVPAVVASTLTDEIEISLPKDISYLGLGLKELKYKSSNRVVVQSIQDDASAVIKDHVKRGMVLTEINGENIEGLDRDKVVGLIKIKIGDNLADLKFRDPALFFETLNSSLDSRRSVLEVSTMILPASKNKDSNGNAVTDQIVTVKRIEVPDSKKTSQLRAAEIGDVLEVSFQLRVKETGEVIDGSSEIAVVGSRMSPENMFFVLGSKTQPRVSSTSISSGSSSSSSSREIRQIVDDVLPPKVWDAGIRGMIIGERRIISYPTLQSQGSSFYNRDGSRNVQFKPISERGISDDKKFSSVDGDLRMGNVKATAIATTATALSESDSSDSGDSGGDTVDSRGNSGRVGKTKTTKNKTTKTKADTSNAQNAQNAQKLELDVRLLSINGLSA